MSSSTTTTAFSLVILTLNEEANIERCIKSVPMASDVVVLDSGSQDKTVEIARRLGARVMIEPWRGFYKQRVRATALALNQWILMLDADEALSPEGQVELSELLKSELTADAYKFPRLSYHMGRWIRHGGWFPDWQIRFFDRQKCEWQGSEVHEKLKAKKIEKLKTPLMHWVFKDLDHQVGTNNRYSGLGAKQLAASGKSFSLFKLLTKPVSKFIETYFYKRGFLDGMPGFIIAVGASYSVFLKYAKLWEMQNQASQNKTP